MYSQSETVPIWSQEYWMQITHYQIPNDINSVSIMHVYDAMTGPLLAKTQTPADGKYFLYFADDTNTKIET